MCKIRKLYWVSSIVSPPRLVLSGYLGVLKSSMPLFLYFGNTIHDSKHVFWGVCVEQFSACRIRMVLWSIFTCRTLWKDRAKEKVPCCCCRCAENVTTPISVPEYTWTSRCNVRSCQCRTCGGDWWCMLVPCGHVWCGIHMETGAGLWRVFLSCLQTIFECVVSLYPLVLVCVP